MQGAFSLFAVLVSVFVGLVMLRQTKAVCNAPDSVLKNATGLPPDFVGEDKKRIKNFFITLIAALLIVDMFVPFWGAEMQKTVNCGLVDKFLYIGNVLLVSSAREAMAQCQIIDGARDGASAVSSYLIKFGVTIFFFLLFVFSSIVFPSFLKKSRQRTFSLYKNIKPYKIFLDNKSSTVIFISLTMALWILSGGLSSLEDLVKISFSFWFIAIEILFFMMFFVSLVFVFVQIYQFCYLQFVCLHKTRA